MPKRKVLAKCFLKVKGSAESRVHDLGEIIESDAFAAYLMPVDDAEALARWKDSFPHAPRSLPVGL